MGVDTEAIRAALEPVVSQHDLELYDVELSGSGRARVLRVSIQDPEQPVALDRLATVSRVLGPIADELVTGHYELEVSSPGIERPLRRAAHFRGAIGEIITIKHSASSDGATVRERGRLLDADDDAATIELDSGEHRTVPYAAIAAARTVFEWGPQPRPGTPKRAKEHTKR